MKAPDVFLPLSHEPPPALFARRTDHPVPKKNLEGNAPVPTNVFYSNLYLGSGKESVFCQPYRVWHSNLDGSRSFGLSVSHTEHRDRVLGPDANAKRVNWYYTPRGTDHFNLSARELARDSRVRVLEPRSLSVQLLLEPASRRGSIKFPLVQGMGCVTAIYRDLTPNFFSSIGFKCLTPVRAERGDIVKFKVELKNGANWLLYFVPDQTNQCGAVRVEHKDANCLTTSSVFNGLVQLVKCPSQSAEEVYDRSVGAYATDLQVSGSVTNDCGRYTFTYTRGDQRETLSLLTFALPHHVAAFDERSTACVQQGFQLASTVKGYMSAILGNSWSMVDHEQIPIDLVYSFMDRCPQAVRSVASQHANAIQAAADQEVKEDIPATTNLDSMYFSGKAMDRFAQLCYALWRFEPEDCDKLGPALAKLKNAFARFAKNTQKFPLVYDGCWKGVTSSASYGGGDKQADFGNTLYNDHHFHFGYFIHAAAVIALIEHSRGSDEWLAQNREYVNTLVRDASNSSTSDPHFPFSRCFDWYNGHSWAKGVFESWDGKDEESSSEDVHFAYSLALWGAVNTLEKNQSEAEQAIYDATTGRGLLMLAILRRSCREYMHFKANTPHHPPAFALNRVSGIMFEGKVDHTTYFGANIEFTHGIHMLPATPASAWVRDPTWCKEEWDTWFNEGRAEKVEGGWRGVLMASRIGWDVVSTAGWFFDPGLDRKYLDGGMSLAYYRALAAEALVLRLG